MTYAEEYTLNDVLSAINTAKERGKNGWVAYFIYQDMRVFAPMY